MNQSTYNLIAFSDESTVLSEYKKDTSKKAKKAQSEKELEASFIAELENLGYEYLKDLKSEEDLINNLKTQLEALNHISFSPEEWQRFFASSIASKNDDIIAKSKKIQTEEYIQILQRDDGRNVNIKLIEKDEVLKNNIQVINQYKNDPNKYDVTILINGLPLVHVELKKRGVDIKEAFNQINRYQHESFFTKSGLFEFVQIFIISNGTYTKYYSNTTRINHLETQNGTKKTKTSNSFEFTSYWADAKNKNISDLLDFAKTFLTKRTLLNVLSKYCILNVDNILLVMRPYQIVACERILAKTIMSHTYKKYGSIEAGGYIWHTTGSGKTLTSFKTAGLISKLEMIDKVLFIVDRKDLDYQTIREYNKFQKDCVNSNASTRALSLQLNDNNKKIIVTTIQKLSRFVNSNENSDIFSKHVVMIFDECHRSQFGEFHEAIIKKFKKYYLFGFTGTPIFNENMPKYNAKTTKDVFGSRLHAYTIINAIEDKNVLPFKVSYHNTIEAKSNIKDRQVIDIDDEEALSCKKRIKAIAQYIIENFDIQTKKTDRSFILNCTQNIAQIAKNRQSKEIKTAQRIHGFNSILACSSIQNAKSYYEAFNELDHNLKIATIFSLGDENDDFEDEEELSLRSREFFEKALKDYNANFSCSYSVERFDEYYKDLSLRVKNKQIDILIVVNMFLTGFDATTLNTLWVDKNLKFHGLLQAFSRTNRILNSIKSFGNIVCFRNLNKNVDDALALFGDENKEATKRIILLRPFSDYFYGYDDEKGIHYEGYIEIIEKLRSRFVLGENIIGENNKKEFLRLFGQFLRVKNILESFEEFEPILYGEELQDYQSMYIDTYASIKNSQKGEKVSIVDDVVFEVELINSVTINVDYILNILSKVADQQNDKEEIKISINKLIDAHFSLRSKKELINKFIENINIEVDVFSQWDRYIEIEKEEELNKIIKDENLNEQKAKKFMQNSFENGFINELGIDLDEVMPKVSLFGNRSEIKECIIAKLKEYFERFSNV